MEYNQNEQILNIIKNDEAESLKSLIGEKENFKHLKLGNLPLVSVSILYSAKECTTFLLSLYREINSYSEEDAPQELTEKFKNTLVDFSEKIKENQDEKTLEKESDVTRLYEEARFIEPSEIAFLLNDITKTNEILKEVGIKTLSARNRLEKILSETKKYSLCGKENNLRIVNINKKTNGTSFSKRKKLLLYALIAMLIAVIVPVIVLASIRVKVTYYVDNEIYGNESGVGGANITVTEPTKEGHTFIGWFTDPELSENVQNKLPKKSCNLYAGWSINSYTIILDRGDYVFSNDFERENVGKYGSTLNLPIPKLDGKLFLGWYDSDGNLLKSNVYQQNLTLSPKFADFENNSIDNPYEISDQNEFLYLSEQEGYFTVKDGLIIDDKFISSGALCNRTKGFIGQLDGQGRTLYYRGVMPLFLNISEKGSFKNINLSVDENIKLSEYTLDRFGIVSAINSGLLENVNVYFSKNTELGNIKNVEIDSMWYLNYVGAITGSNSGEIRSCYVDGGFELDIPAPYRYFCYLGGMVGANIGLVENSHSSANVHIELYNGGFGGLIGYNSGTVKGCSTIGKINVNGATLTTADYIDGYVSQIGGIVAINGSSTSQSGAKTSGKIESCVNRADITISNQNTELYSGGIVSFSEGAVVSSENFGKITIQKTEYVQYLGGIVGFAASRGQGNIYDCKNHKSVETVQKGYAYLGGIAGYSISSNMNDKFKIEKCTNNGDIKNGTQTGGIVGYSMYSALSECINNGTVSAVISSENDSSKAMGGIIGGAVECMVTDSFNHGNITLINLNDMRVTNYLGGLIADNIDTKVSKSANYASLSYGNNDVAGLICGVANIVNGKAVFESVYALSDGKTPSYYGYDSTKDENGDYVDHDPEDKTKPRLTPENEGLVGSEEELKNIFENKVSTIQ